MEGIADVRHEEVGVNAGVLSALAESAERGENGAVDFRSRGWCAVGHAVIHFVLADVR
ncbi:MAG: hypothetical protein K2K64_05760 [Muribaculaceae bacterium]|nr:hypothetical protein [Muribaculaceae bacterium]